MKRYRHTLVTVMLVFLLAFPLCPVSEAQGVRVLRVLTVGDSNTYGVDPGQSVTTTGGYRTLVENDLKARGVYVDMAGDVRDNVLSHDQDTSGHNGWTTDEIDQNITTWVTTWHPDYVLLMAGTNDVFQARPDPLFYRGVRARMLSIIDKIHHVHSSTVILVATVPPSITKQDQLDYVNSEIAIAVNQMRASGHNVEMVFPGAMLNDIADGVHLAPSGQRKVADAFLSRLPQAGSNYQTDAQPCQSPRPPVSVSVVIEPGRFITKVRSGAGILGHVQISSTTANSEVRTGRATPTEIHIVTTRTAPGAMTTQFTAFDDCGPWQSFSGVGP